MQIAHIKLEKFKKSFGPKRFTVKGPCIMSEYTKTSMLSGVLRWKELMRLCPPHGMHPTCALLSALAHANPDLVKEAA